MEVEKFTYEPPAVEDLGRLEDITATTGSGTNEGLHGSEKT